MVNIKKIMPVWATIGAAAMLISACQPMLVETGSPATQSDAAGNVTTIEEPETSDTDADADASPASGEASMIELSGVEEVLAVRAVEELAAEMGIETSAISVTAMDAVDWPDASLGCPEDGMMYAAVLTSGYKIMLEANGEQHEYHSSNREDSHLVKCESEK